MPLCRNTDQVNSISVIRAVQHVEGLAEAEIAQDVHGQPVAPVRHILGRTPAFLLVGHPAQITNCLAKCADVGQDVTLHLFDRPVREGVGKHTALSGVEVLVSGVVGVRGGVDEGVIELGLANIGTEAIDFFEGRVGVDRERIGAEPHELAVFLM